MRKPHFFVFAGLASILLFACEESTGGGSGGSGAMQGSSSSSSSGEAGAAGAGGMAGAGGAAGAGGIGGLGGTGGIGGLGGAGGIGGLGGAGGAQPENALCGISANGAMCAQGLQCCYPCGIPDCDWKCTKPCDPASPGCANGCPLLP